MLRVQGLTHGGLLVPQSVSQTEGGDGQLWIVQRDRALAQHRLEPEAGLPVAGRVVRNDLGLGRVNRVYPVQHRGERCSGLADQLGQALNVNQPAVAARFHAGDEPLLVPDLHDGARRRPEHRGRRGPEHHARHGKDRLAQTYSNSPILGTLSRRASAHCLSVPLLAVSHADARQATAPSRHPTMRTDRVPESCSTTFSVTPMSQTT